jgi:hypothetical protein
MEQCPTPAVWPAIARGSFEQCIHAAKLSLQLLLFGSQAVLNVDLPIGNTEPDDFNLLRKQVEEALAEEIAGGEVAVRVTAEGLVINLGEVGFF